MADPMGVISTVAKNSIMMELWKLYQKKYSYAVDVTWEMVTDALAELEKKGG
jgi:hypothetical protein